MQIGKTIWAPNYPWLGVACHEDPSLFKLPEIEKLAELLILQIVGKIYFAKVSTGGTAMT
jgi:hypothetical protein